VARRTRIVLVTNGLSDRDVSAMGFVRYDVADLQKAVDDALAPYGNLTRRVVVLREAPDILPMVE